MNTLEEIKQIFPFDLSQYYFADPHGNGWFYSIGNTKYSVCIVIVGYGAMVTLITADSKPISFDELKRLVKLKAFW